MPLTRTAAPGNGPDEPHADRVHLEVTRDTNGPGQTARRESLPEWRAQPVTGICQHTAEADTGCDHVIDLGERYLRLRPCRSMFGRNASPLQTCSIARPALGEEKAQRYRHRHLAARQRQ